jgi:hypothetical protein
LQLFKTLSISWIIGSLTSFNCSQSRIKCSIVSPSFSHSRHNAFGSFLYFFILLLWRMYAPVNNFNLIGSLWRSPFDLQLIFNIGYLKTSLYSVNTVYRFTHVCKYFYVLMVDWMCFIIHYIYNWDLCEVNNTPTRRCAMIGRRYFYRIQNRVKSVALWSANIRKLAKDHKGYGSAAIFIKDSFSS